MLMPIDLSEKDFLKNYSSYQNQFMWFLGAGSSRTAGLPTATDLIWDLKIKYYCIQENQNIDSHDAKNELIRNKVQLYMDSKSFPKLWDATEYSFYFDLLFGKDYDIQQNYLMDQLSDTRISLNIGHRALAGLIALNKVRLVFTTNFDGVIEKAHAFVAGKNIPTFHLEGSYAALNALNQEQFPIYAKIHGDFRYKSVKNLSQDLLSNDIEIQKCFNAAATRFGIIISGYSGRDANVMAMFHNAIQQNNAFPFGLYWLVTNLKEVSPQVVDFIEAARKMGINANIVEVGTFDSILSKIWKLTGDKTDEIIAKVRSTFATEVNIPLNPKGKLFPILRTNALKIVSVPTTCAKVEIKTNKSYRDVKDLLIKNKPNAIITKADEIVAFGEKEQIIKGLGNELINSITSLELDNPIQLINANKIYHSFYERTLATAICRSKPLKMQADRTGFILSVSPEKNNDPIFNSLKESLKDRYGNIPPISGTIPSKPQSVWSEALHIKIEPRGNNLYLMLRPTINIYPMEMRRDCKDFLRNKVVRRWNQNTHHILNAWIAIILGNVKSEISINLFAESDFPAQFKINPRTAYSQR